MTTLIRLMIILLRLLGTTTRVSIRLATKPQVVKVLLPNNFPVWRQEVLNFTQEQSQYVKDMRHYIRTLDMSRFSEAEIQVLTKQKLQRLEQMEAQAQALNMRVQSLDQDYQHLVASFEKLGFNEKLRAQLPYWMAIKLPEDWRQALVERRRQWVAEQQPRLIFYFKTAEALLQMIWAAILIRCLNWKWFGFQKKVDD